MLRRILPAVAGPPFRDVRAPGTLWSLRPERHEPAAAAVLYSIEVRNGAGDLLASPMLVGEEGRPVHLDYLGPRSELNMSLDLDPQPDGPGVCLGYKLSIDDGFAHAGRMGVKYGVQ